MLFSQSEVNLAALRTVKLSPALIYLAIPQDLHDLQIRRVSFRVSKNTRRAPPFRLGDAQVCVTHRIVKDHPHDPHIEFTTQRFGRALKFGKDQGSEVSVDVLVTSSKQQAGIPGPLFIPDEIAWPMSTLL